MKFPSDPIFTLKEISELRSEAMRLSRSGLRLARGNDSEREFDLILRTLTARAAAVKYFKYHFGCLEDIKLISSNNTRQTDFEILGITYSVLYNPAGDSISSLQLHERRANMFLLVLNSTTGIKYSPFKIAGFMPSSRAPAPLRGVFLTSLAFKEMALLPKCLPGNFCGNIPYSAAASDVEPVGHIIPRVFQSWLDRWDEMMNPGGFGNT